MRTLVASLICLGSVKAPVPAQVVDYYRGTVVNSQSRDKPATLELSVFQRSDTTTTGWLKIGRPLEGTGLTAVLLNHPDSLYLVSYSEAGDTIVWGSATRSGTIGGSYWITGGRSSGQGG